MLGFDQENATVFLRTVAPQSPLCCATCRAAREAAGHGAAREMQTRFQARDVPEGRGQCTCWPILTVEVNCRLSVRTVFSPYTVVGQKRRWERGCKLEISGMS